MGLVVLGGQPQTTGIAIMASWDAVSDKGVLAQALHYQPCRYQTSRGRAKLVQMIGLGDSDRSQPNYVNCQNKLVVNSLAHVSLKGVCNSFFKWDPNLLLVALTFPKSPC